MCLAGCHRFFPTAQSPRFAGNKVSLRPSRQVDAPNQCSSANSAVYKLLRHWHSCIARRGGCFVSLRSLSHSLLLLQPAFGQLLVSFHATSFITSFVPFHYTTFVTHTPLHRRATLELIHEPSTRDAQPFRKPSLLYSLGSISLHYVLHSF